MSLIAGLLSLSSMLGLCTTALAGYVALGLLQHAHNLRHMDRWRWLAFAAVTLGSGIWSLSSIMQPTGSDSAAGYAPLGLIAAWVLALALSLVGMALATRRPLAQWQVLAGAAVFGLSLVVVPIVNLASLGLRAGHDAWAQALAASLAVAEVGAAGAFALSIRGGNQTGQRPALRQLLSALLLGLSACVCVALASSAAEFSPMSAPAGAFRLTPSVVATFAAVTALGLALAFEMLRRLDSRMRASLERARVEVQGRSTRDALTGLPNRASFEGTLAQAAQHADAANGGLAMLLIALDGMTQVNVSYGHHGGDRALKEIAKRLSALAAPHMLARLHSDEFLLLMPDGADKQEVTALAERVLQQVCRPIALAGQEAILSCSIGVVLYPIHGAASTLIAHASVAMRAAKRAGGGAHSFFDSRLIDDATDRAELLRDLRLAMERKQFELYYQPKVHAPSGQITGAEALLRWNHPARGMVSPAVFIPLAERNGLICTLGDWVIEQACHQARLWRDAGLRMRVAINLSPVQLRQPDLAKKIAATLLRHHINPDLLTCEITESVALEDTPTSRQIFADLAAVGVHISIDDFGSGYANLANLRKLPAKELKIDRSFVLDLASSEEARKVVQAVVNLAKALDRQVVAEGVETEAQFQILRELGCDHLQGFLFAKPMSAKALGVWAINDVGPRSIQFRPSLFKDTNVMQLV